MLLNRTNHYLHCRYINDWSFEVATIQKWGNSLALRIPSPLIEQLQVREGSTVELEVRAGELIVRPKERIRLQLSDLLKDCKPSQLHSPTDFGHDVGREVIDDGLQSK